MDDLVVVEVFTAFYNLFHEVANLRFCQGFSSFVKLHHRLKYCNKEIFMSMDAEVSAKFLTAFQNDDDENDNNNKINYFNNQLRVYMNKLQSY